MPTLASTPQSPFTHIIRDHLRSDVINTVDWTSEGYTEYRGNIFNSQRFLGATPKLYFSPRLSASSTPAENTKIHNLVLGANTQGTIVNGNWGSVVANGGFNLASASSQIIATNSKFDSTSFTWIVFFKLLSKGSNAVIARNLSSTAGALFEWVASTQLFAFTVKDGASYNELLPGDSTWNVSSWQAVVLTKEPTGVNLYHYQNLNELVLLASDTGTLASYTSDIEFELGGFTGNFVNGSIGDVFIFDTVTTVENYQGFLDYLKPNYQ